MSFQVILEIKGFTTKKYVLLTEFIVSGELSGPMICIFKRITQSHQVWW